MKLLSGLTALLLTGTSLLAQDREKKVEESTSQGEETFRILATPYEGDKSDVPSRVFRLKEDDVVMRLQAKSFKSKCFFVAFKIRLLSFNIDIILFF